MANEQRFLTIEASIETPYPGIRVYPPARAYDLSASSSSLLGPKLGHFLMRNPKTDELEYAERFPVSISRNRFRFRHKAQVKTALGSALQTKASRLPRLLRAWGLWLLGAAVFSVFFLAEMPGIGAEAAARAAQLYVRAGAALFILGVVFGVFSRKGLVLETPEGETLYRLTKKSSGFFSSAYSLTDAHGREHVTLERAGMQFWRRRWRLYDRNGAFGPEIVERSFINGLCRKIFGHLWGNFRAQYDVWYNGLTIGRIKREGFFNDGYKVELWKDIPSLDPRLFAACVAYVDHQDPERWHPWFN